MTKLGKMRKKTFASAPILNQRSATTRHPSPEGCFFIPTFPHPQYSYPLAFSLAVCQYIDMFCINCFYPKTTVANSRPHKKQPRIWRRRSCPSCGMVFTTTERPSLAHNQSVIHDNHEISFNLGKLIVSLSRAFPHDPAQIDTALLDLAETIETHLATEIEVITPEEIAAVSHQVLKRYDELAAIQYAAQHQLIASTKRRGRPSLRARERPTGASPSR